MCGPRIMVGIELLNFIKLLSLKQTLLKYIKKDYTFQLRKKERVHGYIFQTQTGINHQAVSSKHNRIAYEQNWLHKKVQITA